MTLKDETVRGYVGKKGTRIFTLHPESGVKQTTISNICKSRVYRSDGTRVLPTTSQVAVYDPQHIETQNHILESGDSQLTVWASTPGRHRTIINNSVVYYYLPDADLSKCEVLVRIHGAGYGHYTGAQNGLIGWEDFAEENKFIVISPAFGPIFEPQDPNLKWPILKKNYWVEPYWKNDELRHPSRPPLTYEEKCCYENYYRDYIDRLNVGGLHKSFIIDRPLTVGGFRNSFIDNYKCFEGEWRYVNEHQHLLNPHNIFRSDRVLNFILDKFIDYYNIQDQKISIVGWSGGCQFISRYMLLYPDRLKRIALGSGSSYMFPIHEALYPMGMRCQWDDCERIVIMDKIFKSSQTEAEEDYGYKNTLGLKKYFPKIGWTSVIPNYITGR